jgi:NADH-quinone oxidoreductase subunit A
MLVLASRVKVSIFQGDCQIMPSSPQLIPQLIPRLSPELIPELSPEPWRLGAYLIGVLALVGIMLILPQLVGERHRDPHTATPYEAGVAVTGSARVRMSAQYYLVAMLFVVFDLEAVFLYAWAVAAPELGWAAFVDVLVFIGVLLATLFYLWRVGALEWGTSALLRSARTVGRGGTAGGAAGRT